ncbi:MAG: hypothetical protein LBF33_01190 [Oscillospiraceae bacterium]|jgi:hypothetical protein|nr:hypothetical protein [Oscillospiraceae bacterium]
MSQYFDRIVRRLGSVHYVFVIHDISQENRPPEEGQLTPNQYLRKILPVLKEKTPYGCKIVLVGSKEDRRNEGEYSFDCSQNLTSLSGLACDHNFDLMLSSHYGSYVKIVNKTLRTLPVIESGSTWSMICNYIKKRVNQENCQPIIQKSTFDFRSGFFIVATDVFNTNKVQGRTSLFHGMPRRKPTF